MSQLLATDIRPEGAELSASDDGWKRERLQNAVDEISAGDWGQERPLSQEWVQCRVLRGTDFPKARLGELDDAPIRYLKPASVATRNVAVGDLIVEMSGGSRDQATGRILLITERVLSQVQIPVAFSNFTKRIRLRTEDIDPSFFRFYWEWLYRRGLTRLFEKRSTGIRNFKLTEFLREMELLYPSLPDQRRIAQALTTVEHAREVLDKQGRAIDELFVALLGELVSGALSAGG